MLGKLSEKIKSVKSTIQNQGVIMRVPSDHVHTPDWYTVFGRYLFIVTAFNEFYSDILNTAKPIFPYLLA